MKVLLILSCVLLVIYIIWDRLTYKYVNKWRLIFVCGPKGTGKTSDLVKRAVKAIRKGQKVYCTERIPGTYYIDAKKDIGKYHFDENSLVLIDEVGMIYDNRKYKDFPDYVRDWYKLQRHRKITVVMYSQSWDIDLKLKWLCDEMYILDKKFRVLSIGKGVYKQVVINDSSAQASSNVDQNLQYMPLLSPRSRTFTFIPKWAGLYDSFIAPKLDFKPFEMIPIPEELYKVYKIKMPENTGDEFDNK